MRKCRSFGLLSVVLVLGFILASCGTSESSDENGEEKTESWPHNKTTIILPFDAGGSLDNMMRVLSEDLGTELDTDIKIDNRPGAATEAGTTAFMNEKDDGSVLFGGTQLYFSASILLQNADYDVDDLAMVNIEQFDPVTITVHKDSPYETLDDLIEDAQENPGTISYSTVHGGPLHLTGVLLEDKLDTEFNPVFYDGGGEMRNALLGEHVDFMIGNALGDNAIADNVRVLAVEKEDNMELWPDAEPINDVLEKYDTEVPLIGSVRFLATHATFKEEHPEEFETLVDAYKSAYESDNHQEYIKDNNAEEISEFRGPKESDELNHELHELLEEYQDKLDEQ